MKKLTGIFFITLCFLFMFSTAFATSWQWVTSDNKYGWFFDTDTIHYELTYPPYSDKPIVDVTLVTFWLKTVCTPEGANELAKIANDQRYRSVAYSVMLKTMSLCHKTYIIRQIAFYDKNGNIIESGKGGYINHIIPGSYDDAVFFAVRDYASAHHNQLIRNAYNN